MKTIHLPRQSGSSLVIVLTVLATLMVVVAVAAEYTNTVSRHVQRSNTEQSAVAVGDSCIEIMFAHWRKICSANPTTAKATDQFDTEIPLPTAAQLNLPSVTNFAKRGTGGEPDDDYDPNYTISNYKVVAVGPEWQAQSPGAAPEPMIGQVAPGFTTVKATTSLVFNYMAFADVTLPALGVTGNRTIVARVSRVFQKQQISPWNFAIFYVDPLEIHPGPDFVVTGWVHTNSDLYTAHESLTFADKVTYGEDWTIGYMPGDGEHTDTPTSPHYPSDLPPARDQALQPFGLDANSLFNTTDANNNNDSYRELIEPPTASPDPLNMPGAPQRYWDQADVVIQVDNSNNIVIGKPKPDGTISVLPGPTPTAKDTALYNMFSFPGAIVKGTSTSNGIIQDNREGGQVRLITLDISKIQNNTSTLNPTFKAGSNFNGIVYIYDNSASTHALNADGTVNPNPTSPVRRGVRLVNGSKIDASGLTVVSPNPVYIQGDYNTGRDYDGTPYPASNGTTSDPLIPQVTGYNNPSNPSGTGVRAPCSVLGDAVTILSNSWVDSASSTKPPASNTTVNTAIISGIVPTNAYGGNNYSGGAENFPRFLEAWDSDKFTYYGSMVELFKSRQSTAIWQYDPVYGAPDRQWYFDMNFRTKPPPGSLMLYSYIKGKWSAY